MVAEVVALEWIQGVIQFIDKRDAGRNIELEDLLFGEVVEVFDKGSEAIPMGSDDDTLAGFDGWGDFFVPEGEKAVDRILEALGEWELVFGYAGVAGVVAGPAFVGFLEGGRGDVVAAAPDEDLLVTEFRGGLGFVEALERSVVAFVQSPVLFHWDPELVEFGEDAPEGVEGAFENGDVGDVEGEALAFQELAGSLGFFAALVAEVDIVPTGEKVFLVPSAFAVADENEFVHNAAEGSGSAGWMTSFRRRKASCLRFPEGS